MLVLERPTTMHHRITLGCVTIRETVEDAQCRHHGDAAIVSGVVVVSIPNAEGTSTTRARLTDTWIRTGSGWRLVAAHVNEAK
jgi:ketosteroid isomerase-like protein